MRVHKASIALAALIAALVAATTFHRASAQPLNPPFETEADLESDLAFEDARVAQFTPRGDGSADAYISDVGDGGVLLRAPQPARSTSKFTGEIRANRPARIRLRGTPGMGGGAMRGMRGAGVVIDINRPRRPRILSLRAPRPGAGVPVTTSRPFNRDLRGSRLGRNSNDQGRNYRVAPGTTTTSGGQWDRGVPRTIRRSTWNEANHGTQPTARSMPGSLGRGGMRSRGMGGGRMNGGMGRR
jgi:hypothetical protein